MPHLGVRTGARTLALSFRSSCTTSGSEVVITPHPRSRRRLAGTSSDHSASSASYCSSDVESGVSRELLDLQQDDDKKEESVELKTWGRESSIAMPRAKEQSLAPSDVELFDVKDSTVKSPSSEVNSGRIPTVVAAEIDDFFDAAEKSSRKHFADKYNFDFKKEEPLTEGRYEWIRIEP